MFKKGLLLPLLVAAVGCSSVSGSKTDSHAHRNPAQYDVRSRISQEANQLVMASEKLAFDSYNFLKGYNNAINADEQAVLFKTESFAASSRLFAKLAADSNWYTEGYLRTNMFTAFTYLTQSFQELRNTVESTQNKYQWSNRWQDNRPLPSYALGEVGMRINSIEYLYKGWPSSENPIYLSNANKYVQNPHPNEGAPVYMIRRLGEGVYEKVPFSSLEALFVYHQKFLKRGTKAWPWDNNVTTSWETLKSLATSNETLTFAFQSGDAIVVGGGAPKGKWESPNSGVKLVTGPGQATGFGSPEELAAHFKLPVSKAWDKVYRVPQEVFDRYQ